MKTAVAGVALGFSCVEQQVRGDGPAGGLEPEEIPQKAGNHGVRARIVAERDEDRGFPRQAAALGHSGQAMLLDDLRGDEAVKRVTNPGVVGGQFLCAVERYEHFAT